jgi:hypothetical protein
MNEAQRSDIEYLIAHPDQAAKFDAAFGEGAAQSHLQPPEEESGFIDTAASVGAGVVDGITSAVNNVLDLPDDLGANDIPKPALTFGEDADNGVVGVRMVSDREAFAESGIDISTAGARIPRIVNKDEAKDEGLDYHVPKGIVQFATGLVGLGKLGLVPKAATTAGKAVTALVAGAAVDVAVFDPRDPRFADMIREFAPDVESDILDYLASSDDDTDAEGRLKNAIEGSLLGIGSELLFSIARGMKAGTQAVREAHRTAGGADEALNSTISGTVKPDEDVLAGIAKEVSEEIEAILPAQQRAQMADQFELFPELPAVPVRADDLPPGTAAVAARTPSGIDLKALTEDYQRAGLTVDHAPSYSDLSSVGQRAFNWDKMGSGMDVKLVLQDTAEALGPTLSRTLGNGPRSMESIRNAALRDVADIIGEGYAPFAERVARMADTADEQARTLVAGKMMMQSLGEQLSRDTRILTHSGDDPFVRARVEQLTETLLDLQGNLKVIQTGTARAVRSGALNTSALVRISAADGDPREILAATRGTAMHRGINMVNEFWLNSILSGPKTHMVNVMSNGMQTISHPVAQFIGGMQTRNPEVREQAVFQLMSLKREMADSWRMAVKSFKMGDNILDVRNATDDRPVHHAISAANAGVGDTPVGSFVDTVGTVTRLPSRALLAEDEFFKQLNFRANMSGRLAVEARANGLKGDEMWDWIAREMDSRVLDDMGNLRRNATGALDEDVEGGLQAARYATFTQDLLPGSASAKYSEFVNAVPIMRQISPFVRTPANIIKMAATMTPGARHLVSDYKAMMGSGDPELVAKATGMARMGEMVWISGLMLASQGALTGGGPKDPHLRKLWFDAGHRPYTINIGGEAVSYQRIDPFGLPLALIADFAEVSGTMEAENAELTSIVSTAALAVGRTLTDKTYLQGWGEFFELMESRSEDHASSILRRRLASFQPFSSLTRQVAAEIDPVLREQHDLIGTFKAQVPGLSDTLPPRRSWLTGEPITRPGFYMNPLTVEGITPNPVAQELTNLGHSFQGPEKSMEGVELTPEQYSRFVELNGTVRVHGRTLMEDLDRLFRSARYTEAPEHQPGVETRRLRYTRRVIENHRKAARRTLKREDETLMDQIRSAAQSQRAALSSDEATAQSGIEELLNLNR